MDLGWWFLSTNSNMIRKVPCTLLPSKHFWACWWVITRTFGTSLLFHWYWWGVITRTMLTGFLILRQSKGILAALFCFLPWNVFSSAGLWAVGLVMDTYAAWTRMQLGALAAGQTAYGSRYGMDLYAALHSRQWLKDLYAVQMDLFADQTAYESTDPKLWALFTLRCTHYQK